MEPDREYFEKIYREMNRPEFIHPDPLEFVWRYKARADRETAGIIAACLAYGNVTQILRSVEKVLSPMGPSPSAWLKSSAPGAINKAMLGFRHRFTPASEMALFLHNIKRALEKYGSLEALFLKGSDTADTTVEAALYNFIDAFNSAGCAPSLTPCTALKSSFKRMNLYLRWMVRSDAVDPGVWKGISPSKLIIPLDTHMRRVAMSLGMTQRKDTSMRTAAEITTFFRKLSPSDPVKYDFALTRAGIRGNNMKNVARGGDFS
ncbi:MAG: TIGR02757 family protein [Elusimicrobia bacterium CG08_land_8_20_14_0_20_59_10]|nr:MAG: TIGR02757 family protein [Elusimicrobia bacterium CG08_land_8_20_14_0_20_59_10]